MQRRLTAILSADVVGYSGLMEADEAGTLDRLKVNRTRRRSFAFYYRVGDTSSLGCLCTPPSADVPRPGWGWRNAAARSRQSRAVAAVM